MLLHTIGIFPEYSAILKGCPEKQFRTAFQITSVLYVFPSLFPFPLKSALPTLSFSSLVFLKVFLRQTRPPNTRELEKSFPQLQGYKRIYPPGNIKNSHKAKGDSPLSLLSMILFKHCN